MNYPENVIIEELMWEYNYTEPQAKAIVNRYKQNHDYSSLCELIQHRMSLRNQEEMLYV